MCSKLSELLHTKVHSHSDAPSDVVLKPFLHSTVTQCCPSRKALGVGILYLDPQVFQTTQLVALPAHIFSRLNVHNYYVPQAYVQMSTYTVCL